MSPVLGTVVHGDAEPALGETAIATETATEPGGAPAPSEFDDPDDEPRPSGARRGLNGLWIILVLAATIGRVCAGG